ncbi:hypothetical protein AJ80_03753 [Polytolypa hystricis UAMH7299]|uniref:Calcineurin-like phosphoesterase domain-containing protein n=1 Tax=Polytolypa hystricis (strain UAMH7299) TaxID=1447883 RepID=A0A2B7YE72_POLH7|nr:hypothetical protein AJ80_03753 [Polytolypa hystricis UAMH7299]
MAETKFQILSDLHLETPAAYDIFTINPKAPYLALLGDIGYVKDKGFLDFLRQQLQNFQIVFLLLGNHEPFESDLVEAKSVLNQFAVDMEKSRQEAKEEERLGEFIFLDQTRYDISPTVTVLGCTLFTHVVPEQSEAVSFGVNDFYRINNWSIEAHQKAHVSDRAWLNREVESISRVEPERKIVVLTHHCPCVNEEVVNPAHAKSNLSSGFMSNLSNDVCWKSANVKVWAFGHTHYNCDFKDAETGKRVLSNQRGYYFAQSKGFNGEKVVRV